MTMNTKRTINTKKYSLKNLFSPIPAATDPIPAATGPILAPRGEERKVKVRYYKLQGGFFIVAIEFLKGLFFKKDESQGIIHEIPCKSPETFFCPDNKDSSVSKLQQSNENLPSNEEVKLHFLKMFKIEIETVSTRLAAITNARDLDISTKYLERLEVAYRNLETPNGKDYSIVINEWNERLPSLRNNLLNQMSGKAFHSDSEKVQKLEQIITNKQGDFFDSICYRLFIEATARARYGSADIEFSERTQLFNALHCRILPFSFNYTLDNISVMMGFGYPRFELLTYRDYINNITAEINEDVEERENFREVLAQAELARADAQENLLRIQTAFNSARSDMERINIIAQFIDFQAQVNESGLIYLSGLNSRPTFTEDVLGLGPLISELTLDIDRSVQYRRELIQRFSQNLNDPTPITQTRVAFALLDFKGFKQKRLEELNEMPSFKVPQYSDKLTASEALYVHLKGWQQPDVLVSELINKLERLSFLSKNKETLITGKDLKTFVSKDIDSFLAKTQTIPRRSNEHYIPDRETIMVVHKEAKDTLGFCNIWENKVYKSKGTVLKTGLNEVDTLLYEINNLIPQVKTSLQICMDSDMSFNSTIQFNKMRAGFQKELVETSETVQNLYNEGYSDSDAFNEGMTLPFGFYSDKFLASSGYKSQIRVISADSKLQGPFVVPKYDPHMRWTQAGPINNVGNRGNTASFVVPKADPHMRWTQAGPISNMVNKGNSLTFTGRSKPPVDVALAIPEGPIYDTIFFLYNFFLVITNWQHYIGISMLGLYILFFLKKRTKK